MIIKEIRGDVKTNSGQKINKLICLAQFRPKSFEISIKNNSFKEAYIVQLSSLLSPYLSETSTKILGEIVKEAYLNISMESKIAS